MKYIVIAGTSSVLPFAVDVDADSIEAAVDQAVSYKEGRDMTLSAILVIDKQTGEVKRPYKEDGAWKVSNTAYATNIGVFTPDEYFTTEM